MIRAPRPGKPDYLLALTVFLLCLFGIVMISSASIVISQERFNNNFYYVTHQLISLAVGLVGLIIAYFIDYRFWKKIALILFLISLILLLAVFIPGIGKSFGGAHRWLGLGNFLFQPSELVKLTFIIYLASWLQARGEQIRESTPSSSPSPPRGRRDYLNRSERKLYPRPILRVIHTRGLCPILL